MFVGNPLHTARRIADILPVMFGEFIIAHAAFAAALAQSAPVSTLVSTQSATEQNSRQIDDMARRLEALEKRNSELQGQVVELKAQTGEQWLTEERAAEVRALVKDVLADSATRTSLQSTSATAGWDNGFFIASADNRFRLEVGGLVQARWIWSELGGTFQAPSRLVRQVNYDEVGTKTGFDLNNIELWAQGHIISPDIQYMVKGLVAQSQDVGFQASGNNATPSPQPTFISGSTSGGLQLLDAWVRVNLTDDWSIRVGQFRAPFGREFLILEQYQIAVDRSLVSIHYGLGYTQGIELEWLTNEARWRFSVNDGGTDNIAGPAQVVGSQPLNSPWYAQTNMWGATTRFDWKGSGGWAQFDQFTSPDGSEPGWLLGLALHAQKTRPDEGLPMVAAPGNTGNTNTWIGVTTDLTIQFGGASLFASAYYNYVNSNAAYLRDAASTGNAGMVYSNAGNVNALGLTLQASAYIAPKWEVFTRYEYMHTTASNSGTTAMLGVAVDNYLFQQRHMSLTTFGVNWYIDGQDVKVTTDFGLAWNPVYPSYATPSTGWRVSNANEFVMRAQMQLMF